MPTQLRTLRTLCLFFWAIGLGALTVVPLYATGAGRYTTSAPGFVSVTQAAAGALTVTKIASPTIATVGDLVTYTYRITNMGSVTVSNLQAVDDPLGAVVLSTAQLAPSQTTTGVLTYQVALADLPGPLVNTVVVSGNFSLTQTVQVSTFATVPLTGTASLSVSKSVTPTLAQVGEPVTYTYLITNTGQLSVSALQANDNRLGAILLPQSALAAGAVTSATVGHLVTAAELPGPLVNTVVVTGTAAGGTPVSASAATTLTLMGNPALSVIKAATPLTASVGAIVTYTYSVTNTGDVELHNLAANDDQLGAITLTQASLAPGAGSTTVITYAISEHDLPGPLVNTVTVTGTPAVGANVSATATATVTLTSSPSLRIFKEPSLTTASVGETITYTYRVRNNGDVPIYNIGVVDDRLGAVTLNRTQLSPKQSARGSLIYQVLESDLGQPLSNTVTVTGTTSLSIVVTAQATAVVTLTSSPVIAIELTASTATASVGDVITYTYTVHNRGDVTLSNINVVDDQLGTVTLTKTVLATGEAISAQSVYVVNEGDLPGPFVNLVTATGTPPAGEAVSATATNSVDLLKPVIIGSRWLPLVGR